MIDSDQLPSASMSSTDSVSLALGNKEVLEVIVSLTDKEEQPIHNSQLHTWFMGYFVHIRFCSAHCTTLAPCIVWIVSQIDIVAIHRVGDISQTNKYFLLMLPGLESL